VSLSAQLPILQVVVPLAAAPLAVLVRSARAGFILATAGAWAAFAVAIGLWLRVRDEGVISYALGSWEPPWGIEYRIDTLSSLVLILVAGVAATGGTGQRGSCRQLRLYPSGRDCG
jgi:multicomponent Na+:H+ antiporter subunit D